MSLKKSKFIQYPLVKKPLLLLDNLFWRLLQHIIKDDKTYLSVCFFLRCGKVLNWQNPRSFNEKMQWLKLYGHRPIYTTMADKYAVKSFVADRIGEQYIVPCLGVWDNPDAIDFNSLPNQFVLKCTHNSGGGMCICKDKSRLDVNRVRREIAKGFYADYYLPGRDKQYRDVNRKIIADQFLNDHTGKELRDYKFWCFNGIPTYMYCTNKGSNIYENFYDMDFRPVMIDHGFPRLQPEIEKPQEFELMKHLAEKLSADIPFVRVDFFDVDHHVYFGEFTFFDWGGLRPFNGDWDEELGKLIQLPEIEIKK